MSGVAAPVEPEWVAAVLRFWLQETPPGLRFKKDAAFDAVIEARFGELFERLSADPPGPRALTSRIALAAIIVLDQFPRNLFRGSARAFASDRAALSLARHAVAAGFDRAFAVEARLFVYLPFEHSEQLADQERAVELIAALGNAEWSRYAVAHRDIISRFGRFPHRNAALGRASTAEEIEFLKGPGSSF